MKIQVKTIEQYFLVVLFTLHYNLRGFNAQVGIKSFIVTIQMKATNWYCCIHVVLFIMPHKVVLMAELTNMKS